MVVLSITSEVGAGTLVVKPSLASAAALVVSRPLELVSLTTVTVTVFGSAGVAFFNASAEGLPISVLMKSGIAAVFTSTTSPTGEFGLSPSVGMVVKVTLPAVRFCICRASLVGSSVWSMVSDEVIALSRCCSLIGLSRVPPEISLRNTADRKYCWRLIRSRSPPGRPCRCRTKASACLPEMTLTPFFRLIPE